MHPANCFPIRRFGFSGCLLLTVHVLDGGAFEKSEIFTFALPKKNLCPINECRGAVQQDKCPLLIKVPKNQ